MKKTLLLIAIFLISASGIASAQNAFYYGPKVGLNFSSLSRTTNANTVVRGSLGVLGGYELSEFVSLQAETIYSFEGTRLNGKTMAIDFLKVPVLGKLRIIENFSAEGGVSFNFLTSALYDGKAYKGLKSMCMTLPIGVSYKFLDHFEAGLRYDIPLTDIGLQGSGTSNQSTLLISVAYIF